MPKGKKNISDIDALLDGIMNSDGTEVDAQTSLPVSEHHIEEAFEISDKEDDLILGDEDDLDEDDTEEAADVEIDEDLDDEIDEDDLVIDLDEELDEDDFDDDEEFDDDEDDDDTL
ncbi:MAG TPA: hypothetical protein VGD26_07465 [Chitinophagaceae bacterium]